MAKEVTIYEIDEELNAQFDKLIAEAEEVMSRSAEERRKRMAEVEDLARGKPAKVKGHELQSVINDQLHQRIRKLSLKEVLVYSGQVRPATEQEVRKALRT